MPVDFDNFQHSKSFQKNSLKCMWSTEHTLFIINVLLCNEMEAKITYYIYIFELNESFHQILLEKVFSYEIKGNIWDNCLYDRYQFTTINKENGTHI